MSGRGKARKTIELIEAARQILKEIQPATVRAVCYRLFVAGVIRSMEKKNAGMVSRQLVYARENNVIPWEWIVDETRLPEAVPTWNNPMETFEQAARRYRFDYWSEQPKHVEIWSEKATVKGTVMPLLQKYCVTIRVFHGYSSATSVNDAATDSAAIEKPFVALYIGDRDPSGMHMSEVDLPERIKRYGGEVAIHRIAVATADTLDKADVPSFSADDKRGDARYGWYLKRYGKRCWELDAINPVMLRERLEQAIVDQMDVNAWNHALRLEAVQRDATRDYLDGLAEVLPDLEDD